MVAPNALSAGFEVRLNLWRERMERALDARLPAPNEVPKRLHEAMRYSVLGGGKRVRSALAFATALTVGLAEDNVEAAACAIELVHAYSLVHDDLPAMDDDDLRRGRPTCHKAFDEATAILVGDALQPLAFQLLARMHPCRSPLQYVCGSSIYWPRPVARSGWLEDRRSTWLPAGACWIFRRSRTCMLERLELSSALAC